MVQLVYRFVNPLACKVEESLEYPGWAVVEGGGPVSVKVFLNDQKNSNVYKTLYLGTVRAEDKKRRLVEVLDVNENFLGLTTAESFVWLRKEVQRSKWGVNGNGSSTKLKLHPQTYPRKDKAMKPSVQTGPESGKTNWLPKLDDTEDLTVGEFEGLNQKLKDDFEKTFKKTA